MAAFNSVKIKRSFGTVRMMAGNTKIGHTLNFSTLPGVTCDKGVPCYKKCYATASLLGKNGSIIGISWGGNTKLMMEHRVETFNAIDGYLKTHSKVTHFRWHVSGDIIDQNYLDRMILIAKHNRSIKFLAFTKSLDLDYSYIPSNLRIVYSMWPNWVKGHRHSGLPRAWCFDPKHPDPKISRKIFWCDAQKDEYRRKRKAREMGVGIADLPDKPVTCVECRKCWNLRAGGREVLFMMH